MNFISNSSLFFVRELVRENISNSFSSEVTRFSEGAEDDVRDSVVRYNYTGQCARYKNSRTVFCICLLVCIIFADRGNFPSHFRSAGSGRSPRRERCAGACTEGEDEIFF